MDKPDSTAPSVTSDAAVTAAQAGGGDADRRPSSQSPDERRAARVARRKEAEAGMSWDEVKATRRARATERQDRLAALPADLRAEKEAELAKAKQERLADRTRP